MISFFKNTKHIDCQNLWLLVDRCNKEGEKKRTCKRDTQWQNVCKINVLNLNKSLKSNL